MTHLGGTRIEGDVVEQGLDLVLWNCWGRPNSCVPRIVQLPGGLPVQDHPRRHLATFNKDPLSRSPKSQRSPPSGIST